MRGAYVAAAALVALLVVATTTCQRKPRFQPLKADSSAHVVDSTVVHMRQAQSLWETGGGGENAAAQSALVLWERLQSLPVTEWKRFGDALLDSLGVGYESSQGSCVLAVNFFSRSDPAAGSWPYLFWCGDKGPAYQEIEGRGLHLVAAVSRGFESPTAAGPPGARGVATLFTRRSGTGQQPLLMTWSSPPGTDRWRLAQTLGPDSLGGTGTGEFEPADTTVELVTRTYRPPAYFDECATCPHVYGIHRFRWGEVGFERSGDRAVPSPYSTFVAFVHAMMAYDTYAASMLTVRRSLIDEARTIDWGRRRGAWRIAPGTDETPDHMVFYRGQQEAYRIEFEHYGNDWLISGIQPVPRTLD